MPVDLTTSPIVQSVIGGAAYGVLGYARVRFDPETPESFDPVKLGSTVLFAAMIGVALELLGVQPSFEHFLWALMTFAGTIALFEKGLQAIIKGNREGGVHHLSEAGESAVSTVLSLGGTQESVAESAESGAREYRDTSDDELREEWSGVYPDEEAHLQVDDSAEGDPEAEATDEGEQGGLSPA